MTGVLSAADLVDATRVRSDPSAMEQLAGYAPVAGRRGRGGGTELRPDHVAEDVTSVRVDRAVHRTWWFARWPRREVAGGLAGRADRRDGLHPHRLGGVRADRRRRASDRAVDRELVKREANMESRRRREFRVTGKDRKAFDEAEAREAELNSGFAEMFYVGLVTLTAPDDDDVGGAGLAARAGRRPGGHRAASSCGASRTPGGWRRCRWAVRSARRSVPHDSTLADHQRRVAAARATDDGAPQSGRPADAAADRAGADADRA